MFWFSLKTPLRAAGNLAFNTHTWQEIHLPFHPHRRIESPETMLSAADRSRVRPRALSRPSKVALPTLNFESVL
jgi:hypothetical protein